MRRNIIRENVFAMIQHLRSLRSLIRLRRSIPVRNKE